MGKRANLSFADEGQEALHIDTSRLEQEFAEEMLLVEDGGAVEPPLIIGDQPADERKAV
jgi:hypothetical protein